MSYQDSKKWWDQLARRLNGFQGTYRSTVIGTSGEEEFVQWVCEKLKKFPVALDIGCADGRYTNQFASVAQEIVGLDFSPVMIEKAKQAADRKNVSFMVADAKQLPFQDNQFDLIISRRGPVSAPLFLEEAVRVTKPGGQLIEITIGDNDAYEFKQIFRRGQGYGERQPRHLTLKERIGSIPSIRLLDIQDYICNVTYPSIEDVSLLLSSTPIIDDFAVEQDYPLLKQVEQDLATTQGITRTMHRIIWVAEKMT